VSNRNPIPTRAAVAVAGTAVGLALLLSFKTPEAVPLRGAALGQPAQVAQQAPASSAARVAPATAGTPRPTTAPAGVTSSTTRAAPAAPAPTPTPAPTTATGTTADVSGPVVPTPFGDVQVEIRVVNGKLIDVVALQLPYDRRHSLEISQYIDPVLRGEALRFQSARLDVISGATYTSLAYAQSLQAALDQAHFNG